MGKTSSLVLHSDSQPTSMIEALANVHNQRARLYYAIKGQQAIPSENGALYLQKMREQYDVSVQQVRGMFKVIQGGAK